MNLPKRKLQRIEIHRQPDRSQVYWPYLRTSGDTVARHFLPEDLSDGNIDKKLRHYGLKGTKSARRKNAVLEEGALELENIDIVVFNLQYDFKTASPLVEIPGIMSGLLRGDRRILIELLEPQQSMSLESALHNAGYSGQTLIWPGHYRPTHKGQFYI